MSTEIDKAQVYTDFQGLGALKTRAREGSPEALEVAAKQFEAYLVQQLLREARAANPEGGALGGGEGASFYEDMYDKQIALSVTSGRGIGIAEMLVQQLGQRQAGATAAASPAESAAPAPMPAPVRPARVPPTAAEVLERSGALAAPPPRAAAVQASAATATVAATGATPARFASAEEFVEAVMPHARRVGEELGVDPRLLVAQAALETGWGRSIIRTADGGSSHNLFNIKAHRAWDGPVAGVRTKEYVNGAETMVQADFRAYGSFEESFRDYVDFLRSNPRYGTALTQTHDAEAFARSLQAAGYATDPRYADKIMRIYGNERLAGAVV